MKCPVCDENMDSMVCTCGYDASRDYEKYPTLGMLSDSVESVSGLRDRRNNLVRCAGCGYHGFALNKTEGRLACLRCSRVLTEEELKPLRTAMGWEKAPEKIEKPAEPQEKAPAQTVQPEHLLDMLNQIQKQLTERMMQPVVQPEQPVVQPKQPDAQPEQAPKRIVSIAAGYEHTVVLYADGTVAAVGSNSYGECNISSWRDIVAVAAGNHDTVGLKKDGTVIKTDNFFVSQKDVEKWENIIAIAAGTYHTVGLKRDGTVVAAGSKGGGRCDVSGWRNIVAIAAGEKHTLALDKSGRVLTAGKGKGTKLPWGGWNQVKAVAAGYYGHSAALTKHGMALIAGDGGKPAELDGSNVEIGAGFDFTVVRKADGTAEITGYIADGRNAVNSWTDLERISAGRLHVVGLKKDGTLIAAGKNDKGQCDVDKLMRK